MSWQRPIRPRDRYEYSLPNVTQAQAQLDGERIKGVVPYALAAVAGFIQRLNAKGGDPFLAKPPGTILSIRPALQSTDYIHMVRDISMRPALAVESSIGSTPSPIARDIQPIPQQVSVFAQNYSGWQVGSPAFNYGFQSYNDWLQAQIAGAPNIAGQEPTKPTPAA
jgi:hypothetical protein